MGMGAWLLTWRKYVGMGVWLLTWRKYMGVVVIPGGYGGVVAIYIRTWWVWGCGCYIRIYLVGVGVWLVELEWGVLCADELAEP